MKKFKNITIGGIQQKIFNLVLVTLLLEYELQLQPGARLFVYTDGVPEATSAEKELFGTDRMLEALNADPDASPKTLMENVRAAVDAFVKDTEQFDDLTMLCLEYKGR